MFKVLILVCSMGIAPQDCQPSNALQVIDGPPVKNELGCGFLPQAYFAGSALAPELEGKPYYLKTRCQRTTIGQGNVG